MKMTELLKSLIISYTLPIFIVVMIYFRTRNSYINIALSHENQIDYVLTSDPNCISNFQVLDPNVNFSDHVAIRISVNSINIENILNASDSLSNHRPNDARISHLRWDKGDKVPYCYLTGQKLMPLVVVLDNNVTCMRLWYCTCR